ncbi:MAG: glutamine synthetase type III, partial [Lachnospiraceae bacterium]|nr:glutamine synthetase type III [Lachnospiraceae bacterium]
NTVLNAIVAEAFCEAADRLEKAENFELELHDTIKEYLTDHQRIIFNGDGYSEAWVEEAARRGLPNIRSMVEAVDALLTPKSVGMFEKFHIFTKSELSSRAEVTYETYSKTINIEALTMIDMVKKQIMPAVMLYSGKLAETVRNVKEAGADASVQSGSLAEVTEKLGELKGALDKLEGDLKKVSAYKEAKERAFWYKDCIFNDMIELRAPADALEMMVDKSMWPIPTYGDMLFEV